ncbi:hypothetical protein [Oleidesulfovibrio alaskensis]|uniref:hypothetical protein n=1 Tax=Oleidesulfovibrio alaskensis TaxID=58180 RepID=UPI001A4F722A|nr:hypothetical protein [Oleidesulfovibrio alaskensis]MBL3580832.1 hypothetical protein [Oleidesulfovibrio alaskensis]MBL3587909.1 hypothetical protein [bacterium]
MENIQTEKIEAFLQEVMAIERQYSFEKTGTDSRKVEELAKLVERFCEKELDNEN